MSICLIASPFSSCGAPACPPVRSLLFRNLRAVLDSSAVPMTPKDESIIPLIVGTLSSCGFRLRTSHAILDFGCGAGQHVAAFRDAGYCAYGVDLKDYLPSSCPPEQRSWFRLSSDPYVYRLPWPDQSFDLIFSNQVLEHLMYYEPALEEMRRVLKPQGVVINIFPSKWRFIEPHFLCPLGSWLRWWPWLKFWSMVGTANPALPPGLSRSQKAEINWRTSRTRMAYWSWRELRFLFGLYFGSIRSAEREFVESSLNTSRFSRLVHGLSRGFPPIFWFYRHFHTKVVILGGYCQMSRAIGNYIAY